jgi:hypothetical protein
VPAVIELASGTRTSPSPTSLFERVHSLARPPARSQAHLQGYIHKHIHAHQPCTYQTVSRAQEVHNAETCVTLVPRGK